MLLIFVLFFLLFNLLLLIVYLFSWTMFDCCTGEYVGTCIRYRGRNETESELAEVNSELFSTGMGISGHL